MVLDLARVREIDRRAADAVGELSPDDRATFLVCAEELSRLTGREGHAEATRLATALTVYRHTAVDVVLRAIERYACTCGDPYARRHGPEREQAGEVVAALQEEGWLLTDPAEPVLVEALGDRPCSTCGQSMDTPGCSVGTDGPSHTWGSGVAQAGP